MEKEALDILIDSSKNRVFTGVGSRKTPADVGILMCAISMKFVQKNWVLRSGGADGADLAFESGYVGDYGQKEIHLPYPGFNGSVSVLDRPSLKAFNIAQTVHPAWDKCSDFARKAHARNAHQVLGQDLASPADMLVCWTPDGAVDEQSAVNAGGTRTAIVMAQRNGVPVFNLQRQATQAQFKTWVGEDFLSKAQRFVNMKSAKGFTKSTIDVQANPATRSEMNENSPYNGKKTINPSPASAARIHFRKPR